MSVPCLAGVNRRDADPDGSSVDDAAQEPFLRRPLAGAESKEMSRMHGFEWWPMGGMMVGWLLVTVLAVGLVTWLVIAYAQPRGGADYTEAARRILADRFARGELDTEEYRQRLTALY